MDATVNVAMVGATGAVGETLLEILTERSFPVDRLYALASERSVGNTVLFRNRAVSVECLEGFDFSKVDSMSVSKIGVKIVNKQCICQYFKKMLKVHF